MGWPAEEVAVPGLIVDVGRDDELVELVLDMTAEPDVVTGTDEACDDECADVTADAFTGTELDVVDPGEYMR